MKIRKPNGKVATVKTSRSLDCHFLPDCETLVQKMLTFARLEIYLREQTDGKSDCGFSALKFEVQTIVENIFWSPVI